MNRFFTAFIFFSFLSLASYAAPPVVSSVTIPAGSYKIGSSIVVTIATDGTGYTVDAGTTINGVDVTGTFTSAGGNNYTLTYLVGSGNTDRASIGAIPVNILIRNGAGAGNLNTYTTSPTSGGTVTIDANSPTATGTPTNTGGAIINAIENSTFNITVGSLGATGAVAGDILEIFVDGVSFPTPLTRTLTAGDISGGYTFTNVTLPGADGAKVITAKVTDQAGNIGAASSALNLTLDTTAPTATGTPTNTAGATINSSENGSFDISVGSLGATSAVAGDILEIFVGGVSFSTPLTHTLTAGDISGGYTFTNVTLLGADGAKVITAKVTDQAGNIGAASSALNLTLDTTAPTATGIPTNTAGAIISSSENGSFDISVGSLGATGAVAGDILEIFVGGVSFSTPLTRTLTAGDISGGYTFTNVTLPGADGAKVITTKVTDQAGNIGAASSALNLTLDTTAPTATGTPTNTGGAIISAIENSTFSITVGSLGATGAVAGDILEIFVGGVSFSTPLTRTLTAGDISGGYTFTNVTLPGADGAKVITAKVTDQAGNIGAASSALNLTLDTTAPTATGTPTNTAGATINSSENGSFDISVGSLGATGAVAGDILEIFVGGVSFSTPLTHTLTAGDISGGYTFTNVTLPGADGAKVITAKVTDQAGNIGAASSALNLTLDATAPGINAHNINSITATGFTFTINLSETGTTYYDVTTSSTVPSASQIKAGTSTGHVQNGNFAVGTISTNINQPITGLSGGTVYYVYSVSEDAAGNATAVTTGDNATTTCIAPTAQPTLGAFTSITAGALTANWSGGTGLDGVLVVARAGSAVSFVPVSGNNYAGQINANIALATDQGSGNIIVYRGSGTSVTLSNLAASTTYHFAVYAYKNTADCYLTTSPATGNQVTPAPSGTSTLTAGTGVSTIASIVTSNAAAGAVFTFTLTDIGGDDTSTRLSQFIFREVGTFNPDLTQLIADAQLRDNSGGSVGQQGTAVISAHSITIPGINYGNANQGSNNQDLGTIPDSNNKVYTLRVWFKTSLGGSLPTTIDGQQLIFSIVASDVTIVAGKTQIKSSGAGSSTISNASGTTDVIDVTATKITVKTQPSTSASAGVALATQPVFEATDVNNNRDLGFNSSIASVNTSPNLAPVFSATNFSSGLSTFTDLKFNSVGTSALTITSNSITSAATSAVTISSNTALGASSASLASSPLINSTTGKAVLGFSLQTSGSAVTLTDLTFNSTSSPTGLVKNLQLFSNTTDNFTGATQVATSASLAFSGMSIALSGTAKYFFLVVDVEDYFSSAASTIQFSLPLSGVTVTPTGKTGSTQTGPSYTLQDNTAPTVSNITLPSTNPNNTSSVNFTVVFSEPVTGVDISDFSLYGTASGGTAFISGVTGSGTTYTVTVSSISSTGTLGLNLVDNNTIKDARPNLLGGAAAGDGNFSSASTYTFILPEPPFHVDFPIPTFTATVLSTTSIELDWTDALGSPVPSGYLITVARSGATATIPTDYSVIPTQTDLVSNTTGYLYIAAGVQTTTFSTLLSGESYTFKIYPYTNSGSTTDYKINGTVPTKSAATPVGSKVWINNNSPVEPASFPSTTTSSGVAVINFRFQVWDDDWLFAADNASTKITAIKIRRNTSTDQIGNWNNVLAGAELTDGVTTKTGTVDVSGNFVSFSSLYDGTTEFFGEVPDNAAKFYSLKLILKTNLGSAAIDNSSFVFQMNNADITLASNSSQLEPLNDTNWPIASGSSKNKVTVTATQFDFTTQPISPVLVSKNVTGTPVSPDFASVPVVRARDINGNTDLDYATTLIISNTGSLSMANLNPSPVNSLSMSGGIAVFPTTFQYLNDGNGTLTASNSILTNAVSNPVTVSYSSLSTLTAGATGPISTAISFATPYHFTITDDGGANLGDGAPTRISQIKITKKASASPVPDWRDFLDTSVNGGALIYDGTGSYLNATVTINQNDITISNMLSTSTASDLGYIGDGLAKSFTLYIYIKPVLLNGLPLVVDHMNFDFEVDPANFILSTQGSKILAAQAAINSGPLDVDVDATRLVFSTPPPATASVDADLSTSPIVMATDNNNNLDLDYSASVTITNSGSLTMANTPTSIASGVLTFPSNFQYRQAGNGTLTAASTGLTSAVSSLVTVSYSNGSDIVHDGSFGYTDNIAYKDYQAITILQDANSIDVDRFVVRDGGAATNDADGAGTSITAITLQATNAVNLRSVAIFDGATKIGQASPVGGVLTFTGIALTVGDNSSKAFTLRASFNNAVTDNDVLSFLITSVTKGTSIGFGSAFAAADGGGASSSVSNNNNKIEVVATKIDFTTVPSTASINVSFPVVVQARDVNNNLDADYNGTVSFSGNANTSNYSVTNLPSGSFIGGILNYPIDNIGTTGVDEGFYFTSGTTYTQLTINGGAASTGGGNINAGSITGISPAPGINVQTSYDSWLYFDPSFAYTTKIPYVSMQEDPLTNTTNSVQLARLILSDGGAPGSLLNTTTNPNPGTKNQPLGQHNDADGAFTKMDQLTISLTNFTDIRKIALFDAVGNKIGSDQSANATVTFSGLSGVAALTAPDNDVAQFYIRASFNSAIGADLDQIKIQITDVVWDSGSKFPTTDGITTIGGIDGAGTGGDSSDPAKNYVDVVATSLDFVTSPSPYAGINEPIGSSYTSSPLPSTSAAIIHARDKFANIDLDFDYTASQITITGGGATSSSPFINGVLDLDGMIYSTAGNGTLAIGAGGLNSSVIPADNIGNHISGQSVDVIHVGVTSAAIVTPTNLKGGTLGAILLGVTFTPQYSTTTEPSLKRFVFSFDFPYQNATTTILKNFKVRLGNTDVTGIGATVSTGSSYNDARLNLVTVDWGSNTPVDLFDINTGSPAPKTFYLVADIDISAKIGTQNLTPQLIDAGYPFPSDANIVTTNGTAKSNVVGQTYSFASTRPPVLLTSSTSLTKPYNGQLNVDKNITEIQLEFDVQVWSLDGKAELHDRTNNAKVADLVAINGNFATQGGINAATANPIRFSINWINGNSFQDDGLYYITIKKGTFDNGAGTGEGISDDGFNYYGGISSNSILFFKISSPNPPELSLTKGVFSNLTTGVFQTTFDQRGTAYFMIVSSGSPKPINDQILGNSAYAGSVFARGNYLISLVNSPQTTTVSFTTSLTANTTYDVWIFAKNDANPVNISTPTPYGGAPDYLVTGTTPTLQFTTPTVLNLKNGFQPDYNICPDSYYTLTDPIIIGEAANSDFQSGSVQDFNILLPSGFDFDGVTKPSVDLVGADFTTAATVTWVNNTVVNIRYSNTGAATRDKIIITNLKIRGTTGSNPGSIRRFAGNASIGSIINLASIANLSADQQKFTNSYSLPPNDFTPFGFASDAIITAIPDNYIDTDASITSGLRLIPLIEPSTDYGITSFSGNGVTNDILSLSAVALNTAFDITMTHTNLNGCISKNSVQYVVYDHRTPISSKLGNAGGVKESLINTNFPAPADNAVLPDASLPRINYKDVAGYKLLLLKANIPANPGTQIIQGGAWEAQVDKILTSVNQITTDADLPTALGFTAYNEYQWDYAHILNAVSESNQAITKDPYDNFQGGKDGVGTPNGQHYWTGGSLGKIEFTGTYQSTADLSFIVPFRQEVELFVPPIPVIEINNQEITGVATYCENDGGIIITGYPQAAAGSSTGTFALTSTGASPASLNGGAGFIDNGNGTATLYPNLFNNNYEDIRITYNYQENNSPASGIGTVTIKITPNPVALFTFGSEINANSPVLTAYCEGSPIQFTSSSTIANPSEFSIASYEWNFTDATNSTGESGNNPNTSAATNPRHKFAASAVYSPTLTATSNFGCKSQVATNAIKVGAVPNVQFGFVGVSTADPIVFTSTSVINSSASVNDGFSELEWNYGDGKPLNKVNDNTPVTNQYAQPNVYQVNLKVKSTIGCVNTLAKRIIIVPQATPTDSLEYKQDFQQDGGGWQTDSLTNSLSASSWKAGAISKGTINGKGWATNLTASYNPKERSALYSPSFDLSKLERPMISFNLFNDLEAGEGVVVEYSTDSLNIADVNKKWNVLGKFENGQSTGVDWYNAIGLPSQPGVQATGYGWTGTTTDWLESKHVLDPVLSKPRVVFRYALATLDDTPTKGGIAIDNVRVGNRTRTVLVENFKNLGNSAPAEKAESDFLKSQLAKNSIGTKLVKLNYHVGFPQQDPFNLNNPLDPSSRALYYNIKSTPLARLDGDKPTGDEQVLSAWGQNWYNTQTLKLAEVSIVPSVSTATSDGSIEIGVSITNKSENEIAAGSALLYIAVVEKSVALAALTDPMKALIKSGETDFEYIVKKLLPSGAGTRVDKALALKSTLTFGPFNWIPEPSQLYSKDNMAVVVFLQDEATRKVYQAEIKDVLSDPTPVTGLEESLSLEEVSIYPNPADHELTILLPRKAINEVTIQLFDQVGKSVLNSTIKNGEQKGTLNVQGLAESMYLMRLVENGVLTMKKVVVVHHN